MIKILNKYIERKVQERVAELTPAMEVEITNRLRPEIIIQIDNERKSDWKDKCEFLFHHDGFNYFKYTNIELTHIKRFERSSANMILLGNRLNHNELEKLAGIGKSAIEKCMNVIEKENRIKHLTKALWVFEEMEQRREALMFHPDIMLDLLATNIIREDEDPKTINMDIHNQKIDMFKTKGGDIPFLTAASLTNYLPEPEKLLKSIESTWEMHQQQVNQANEVYQKIATDLKLETT